MNVKNSLIEYRIKTASEEDIHTHLKGCNRNFLPPLEERVNIEEYSRKLFEKSISFEAWANNYLVGLIAAYFNNLERHIGYISNVSLLKEFIGSGIASKLLKMTIGYADLNGIKTIQLEVNKQNYLALKLYRKFNFVVVNEKVDLLIMSLGL